MNTLLSAAKLNLQKEKKKKIRGIPKVLRTKMD